MCCEGLTKIGQHGWSGLPSNLPLTAPRLAVWDLVNTEM